MNNYNDFEKKGHRSHQHLAGEHKFGDSGQIILFVIFLIVWIADSFIFKVTNFPAQYIPLYIRIALAAVVLFSGGYAAIVSHNIIFKEAREKPEVIRKGIFEVVRHPLYLSSLLFYLGLLILTISLVSVGVWIIIIGFYHFIARYEERLLLAKFGDEYDAYIKEVPMWLPWTK
ncbi:MAG TPA: isoprenylcysteine carboxylmethyltransferase family protein [candidate division Zixibacteria bacterium]|nr:isoprenylcysteine carboxylmethyltransferase family protein [candidate division Zixibacteria bacterium]